MHSPCLLFPVFCESCYHERLPHKTQHPCFTADSHVRWMLCHWPPLPQSALWHGHGLIYKPLSAGLSFFLVCELVGKQQKQRYRFRLRPLVACCPDCVHSVLTWPLRKWLLQKMGYYTWVWNMHERAGFFGGVSFFATHFQMLHFIENVEWFFENWTLSEHVAKGCQRGLFKPKGQLIEGLIKHQLSVLSAYCQQHKSRKENIRVNKISIKQILLLTRGYILDPSTKATKQPIINGKGV